MDHEKSKPRSPLRFLTLWVVTKKPSTSKQIMDNLGKRKGKSLSVGTVYPVIKKHKEDGFIESKEKRVYHITPSGKKEMKKMWKYISRMFYDYDEIKQYFN